MVPSCAKCETYLHDFTPVYSTTDPLNSMASLELRNGWRIPGTGACGYNRPCAHQMCRSISVMHGCQWPISVHAHRTFGIFHQAMQCSYRMQRLLPCGQKQDWTVRDRQNARIKELYHVGESQSCMHGVANECGTDTMGGCRQTVLPKPGDRAHPLRHRDRERGRFSLYLYAGTVCAHQRCM